MISDHLTDPSLNLPGTMKLSSGHADSNPYPTNLTGGQLVDLLYRAGLEQTTFLEERFVLDFDESFDRGTPVDSKGNVSHMLLSGPSIRGFRPSRIQLDGSIRIDCLRGMVRGGKPTVNEH